MIQRYRHYIVAVVVYTAADSAGPNSDYLVSDPRSWLHKSCLQGVGGDDLALHSMDYQLSS